jgi:hypothetical protein
MSAFWEFFRKQAFIGQILGMALFVLYFIPFMLWFGASNFLWGIHSMVFGSSNQSPAAFAWGNVPFYGSLAIGGLAAVFQTIGLFRILF